VYSRVQPEIGKRSACRVGQGWVELHARHVLRSDALAQQRGVVAGAGADLQDTVSGLEIEGFEHSGHDGRHGAGTGGGARPIDQVGCRGHLDREYVVCIDAMDPLVTLRGIGPVHQHLLARL
jgi:hypothetical protein